MPTDLLRGATKEQAAAIQHRNGPALVVAGPGSGKTRVITHRIAHLIATGVDPRSIVGITFTNKAADEMKARVGTLLGSSTAKDIHLSTFHSFCVRLMRGSPQAYNVDPKFVISDSGDSKELVLRAMANITGRNVKTVRGFQGFESWKYLMKTISKHKDTLLVPDEVVVERDEDRFFKRVYTEYERLLARSSMLDFDDLIMRVALALRKHETLRDHYARVMKYIMVDEFQDTNFAQCEMVRFLGEKNQNVFVVADDDQSIYKFRGADPKNLSQFQGSFDGTKLYLLQTNFRSRPGIAAVANAVIANNTRLVDKKIITHKSGGPIPQVIVCKDPGDEAGYVATDIKTRNVTEDFAWQDAAVIYRAKFQSRAVEEALMARGIPYKVIGAKGFFQRKTIKDILAYLRLVLNPNDDISFGKVCNYPPRGFGRVSYATFCAHAETKEEPLLPVLQQLDDGVLSGRAADGARQFLAVIRELQELSQASVGPIVTQAIRLSGYYRHVENMRGDEKEDILQLLGELETTATQYDEKTGKGLAGFLEHAALMQDDKDEDPDRVKLMTAHAAKGLEFPLVYMIGLTEGGFPLHLRTDDGSIPTPEDENAHYEEERRVFFVGATRAEERLTVLWPKIRFYQGQMFDCTASRFIGEAGEAFECPYDEDHDDTVGGFTRRDSFRGAPAPRKREPARRIAHRPRKKKFEIPDGGADAIIKDRLKR